MKVRDSQRGRVYAWEKECLRPLDPEDLTLDECKHIVSKVVNRASKGRAMVPCVVDGRGRRGGLYDPARHLIKLPKYARRRYYVLHEVAHVLCPGSNAYAWHGPEWCAVYADLLTRFGGWTAVRSSMRAYGVKVRA